MDEYLEKLRKRLRISYDTFDDEIISLMEACKKDLEQSGIYGDFSDPLYLQAVVLYEKTFFGDNEDMEKMEKAYQSLKTSMALSGDYNGQKQSDQTNQTDVSDG